MIKNSSLESNKVEIPFVKGNKLESDSQYFVEDHGLVVPTWTFGGESFIMQCMN